MYTPAYHPYTLPANAPHCIFELAKPNRDRSQEVKLCGAITGDTSSFCAIHRYVLEVLERGAGLGYPGMQVNSALWIGAGIQSWESYALRHPLRRLHFSYSRSNGRVTGTYYTESHEELITKLDGLLLALVTDLEIARKHALHNAGYSSHDVQEPECIENNDISYAPF